jgi:DUF971 family protein
VSRWIGPERFWGDVNLAPQAHWSSIEQETARSTPPSAKIALKIDIVVRSTMMRLEPTDIQQIGNELAIHWNDGTESYFGLEFLRRACPCAACGGEPDVLGNIARPSVTYSPESFELAGFEFIGGYAVQPRWRDGHGTGIYSFQYLRRLATAHVPNQST